MSVLPLALVLPQLLTAQASAPGQPTVDLERWAEIIYQKSPEVQRVYLTVPARAQGWIRTGINPQALAGREVAIAWTANIKHVPHRESLTAFKQRLSAIALRQVHDDGRRPAVAPPKVEQPTDCELIASGKEVPLPVERPVCFAPLPGELEIRFYGARPHDRGSYRVFFVSAAYSRSDSILNDGVADKVELYEADRKLVAPPPLPEPR